MHDKSPSPSVKELLDDAARRLQPSSIDCADGIDIGRLEAEVLLADGLKTDRAWLHTHPDHHPASTIIQHVLANVARRERHEPMAHILGYKDFYGRRFEVTPDVLTPRPETEHLVDLAIEASSAYAQPCLFWDVGTGSGAIAITLADEIPTATVIASDISHEALHVARRNAARYAPSAIRFLHGNLLTPEIVDILLSAHQPVFIIANLPYLPTSDTQTLQPDVVEYEPSQALFGGTDGLDVITTLLQQLRAQALQIDGIFLEFDPPQAQALSAIAHELFPSARIPLHADLARRDRILSLLFDASS